MKQENLIIGKSYILRTHNRDGSEAPKRCWVLAEWNGQHLIDKDGVYWDEWLGNDGEDIFEF